MIDNKTVIKKSYLSIWTLSIACSIALISCDCGYTYEYIIENGTNSELSVYCKAEYCCGDGINKTVSVDQDTSAIIYTAEAVFAGGGCPGPYKENGIGLIDSILILMNDTMTTKLNYKNIDNWTFTIHGMSNNAKGTYKITLTDLDFTSLRGN